MVQKRTAEEVANDKAAQIMNAVAKWCSFYRANPHRFCKDYLNLELHPFQVVLLFMMNLATNFCFIGSRGRFRPTGGEICLIASGKIGKG